jgi:hypothetical protein
LEIIMDPDEPEYTPLDDDGLECIWNLKDIIKKLLKILFIYNYLVIKYALNLK